MKVNSNYQKLPGSYLFSEIARRVAAYSAAHPDAKLIKLGIGDVTRPLPAAVIEAMHKAVDEMGAAETFRGYGPEQGYDFLREAIAAHDFATRGVDIQPDEIFISDGAKSDCGNIGDLCAVFYIGGNDSMDTIAKLSRYGQRVDSSVRFIGVPKTIDNDLCLTDHTPGYGSAAKYIATILKEVIRDSSVYNIRSVTVAEIMGRHAGWLAGAACLAGGEDCEGPDLILLPEVPFDQDKFLARVDELQRVKSNVIIAASEGVKTADGTYLCDLVSTAGQLDAFGHKAILSGTSRYLSELIHDKLQCKSRAIEFSTLQRCASHLASRTDVNEAYAVGGAAAAAAFAGESGRMIALKRVSNYPYQCITESVDVQQVANLEKKVPLEWITPDGMQVTEAFEEYARPLILDEVTPVYVNGTPRHIRL